jgi:hypothetical protein
MNATTCQHCGSALRPVDGMCPTCLARTITHFIQQPPGENATPEVPGYEVLGLIGQGGMGVVHRALRLEDETEVALKIGSAELFERLQREADTLRQLDHPHLLRVLDSGLLPDGRSYIVTPLMRGGDLAKRLQQGPLPAADALRLFRQVLDAVGHAHARGVVHRDLKPANILLDENGRALVADFSLAKPEAPDIALTQPAEIFGTPYYIAPELRRGAATVDARADIFSLGVLLHEMLTGKLPIGQYEPSRYDHLVSRCLRENPDKRPQTIADLERALQPQPARRWLGAALLLLLLAGAWALWHQRPHPAPQPPARITNSLGMTFAPLPGTRLHICTHETRIRDFDAYSQAANLNLTGPETRWRHPPPGRIVTPEHPVTPVSKVMAERFCDWLTRHERALGRLSPTARYRLPTDAEWTQFAADLPPRHPAPFTQPVAAHAPNSLGLHDLEGNVAEWTSTPATANDAREGLVRGASYASSASPQTARVLEQAEATGFRLVLEEQPAP